VKTQFTINKKKSFDTFDGKMLILSGLILLFMFGMSGFSFSQNSINYNLGNTTPRKHTYLKINSDFLQKNNPLNYQNNLKESTGREDGLIFLMDTIYVHSVSSPSKRYVYTYSNQGYLLTSLMQDDDNGSWVNSTKEELTYDEAGNNLSSIWKFWDENAWVNSSRSTYTYSADHSMLSALYEYWDDDVWKYNQMDTYSYNTGGQVVSHVVQVWSDGNWNNYSKDIYVYDDLGNLLTSLGEMWQTGVWREDQRYTYTYNEYNNLITSLFEQWQDGLWVSVSRDSSEYNAANKKTYWLSQIWNDSVWINQSNTVYTYNELDYLQTLTNQTWQNDSWQNNLYKTFTYGIYGGIETTVTSSWSDNDWVNWSMNQYVYDDYGNALFGNYFFWEGNGWTQNQEGPLEMYYDYCTTINDYFGYFAEAHYVSMMVGIADINASFESMVCYPNPAKDVVNIKFNTVNHNFCNVSLFTLSGQKVKTAYNGQLNAGIHYFKINSADLAQGIYVLKLFADNKLKTSKLEIIK